MVGKATSKSLLSSTMIAGSNAAGEALPPHIQFVTKAQSLEAMRLDFDVVEHVELEAAAGKMSREKRDALRQEFYEMDAKEALNTLASVASEHAQVTTSADGEIGAVEIALKC